MSFSVARFKTGLRSGEPGRSIWIELNVLVAGLHRRGGCLLSYSRIYANGSVVIVCRRCSFFVRAFFSVGAPLRIRCIALCGARSFLYQSVIGAPSIGFIIFHCSWKSPKTERADAKS